MGAGFRRFTARLFVAPKDVTASALVPPDQFPPPPSS
jgi:hypothetical protein